MVNHKIQRDDEFSDRTSHLLPLISLGYPICSDRPYKMLIPSSTIAEYIELRSRLTAIERMHPGIADYFKSRIKMEISDDQKLLNLQAAICGDRELEAQSTEAIGRLAAKIGEEQAVLMLARRFYESGDIERAIASLR